jgi:DNA invertase Pin-like site-specific DNA recombinase
MLHYNDYYLTIDETEELQNILKTTLESYIKDKRDKSREGAKAYSISTLTIPRVKKKK